MGQSPAHRPRGPGMAGDHGYFSVREDCPGRDPEHGGSNLRLESAHCYMIAAPGTPCGRAAPDSGSSSGPLPA